jgi:hypothetical protein
VTAVAAGTTATVRWQPPQGAGLPPIAGYILQASTDGGTTWATVNGDVPAAASEHTLAGLAGGVGTAFRIAARNANGVGAFSAATTPVLLAGGESRVMTAASSGATATSVADRSLATVAATVPGLVSGLTATAGSRQVTLSWTAPADDGGTPITDYEIQVAEQTNGVWSSYRPLVRAASTATSATIAGLTAGKIHIFVVRAVNARGPGQWLELPRLVTPLA